MKILSKYLICSAPKTKRFLLLLSLLAVLINGSVSAFADRAYSPPSLLRQNPIDVSIARLRKNYEFIFFYSADCPYCMSFDPILKSYSDNSGIAVKAFVMGDRSSPSFPNSAVVAQEIIDQFFGRGAKLSVPALFIINKDNFHVYHVSSGALTYLELNARMNQLAPKILRNERSIEQNKINETGGKNV